MATSSNFYEGKSLADFLPENESKAQSRGKQYSYCQNDEPSANLQPTGTKPKTTTKPPDPPDPKKEAKKKVLDLQQKKENLKKELHEIIGKLIEETTNTNVDQEKVKSHTSKLKQIERKWRPIYQELVNQYHILNSDERSNQIDKLNKEHKKFQSLIETVLEMNGEGKQEESKKNQDPYLRSNAKEKLSECAVEKKRI